MTSKFNNYFANVVKNLIKVIGESNNKFQDFLKNPNEHSFLLRKQIRKKYLIYLTK